ncbi:hypothetical protein [Streptomyces sp. t39]|uniref:hypothetical protein n=1 Tax=Streptomyces sp. t39 TaxID=1828156 RepID=UPI0016503854|nr:hypothetical protein [Streptomyces sp. t39]
MGRTPHFATVLRTSATLTFTGTTPGDRGPVADDVTFRSRLLVLRPPTGSPTGLRTP